ncbi:hypothetical protein BJ165DRAFT_242306 [Panaeolus papilionaceus]|nr:hypothetical protein BJ165DRAFT_242306 [Panaeolus papilionaceus]
MLLVLSAWCIPVHRELIIPTPLLFHPVLLARFFATTASLSVCDRAYHVISAISGVPSRNPTVNMCFNRVLDLLTSSWCVVLFHLYLLKMNSFVPFPSHLITINDASPQTLLTNFDHPNFFHQFDSLYILLRIQTDRDPDPPWSCFLRAGNMVEVKAGPFPIRITPISSR